MNYRMVCGLAIMTAWIMLAPGVTEAARRRPTTAPAADSQPAFDPKTLKLFTAGDMYLEKYQTGLYPGGGNDMPAEHRAAGVKLAGHIRPLNVRGEVDDKNGRIIALVIGHSNCSQYFSAFGKHLRKNADKLNPRFELLSAAAGGQQLPQLLRPDSQVWGKAGELLSRDGYSAQQVQVLFMHTTWHGARNPDNVPPGPFPETMQEMQRGLATVLARCARDYPNLRIAYLTCDGLRQFSGHEPHVWREAFAFKWLIESQIKGEKGTEYLDTPDHKRQLPWISWGPYIWDNTWDRSYFGDGVHPSTKAEQLVAEKYWRLLVDDPVAQPWMFKPAPAGK